MTRTTTYQNYRLHLKVQNNSTTVTYTFPSDTYTIDQLASKYAEIEQLWEDNNA